jgi:hypothetical protein
MKRRQLNVNDWLVIRLLLGEPMIKLLDILKESPDTVNKEGKWYDYTSRSTVPFIVASGKIWIGDKGEGHGELSEYILASGGRKPWKHLGRIFFTPKVITFWDYPKKDTLKSIIKAIEDKFKIKIMNNGYTIELNEFKMMMAGINRSSQDRFVSLETYLSSNDYYDGLRRPQLRKLT